jgi:hypothetical protein
MVMDMVGIRRLIPVLVVTLLLSCALAGNASATEAYIKVKHAGIETTLAAGETRTQSIGSATEVKLFIPSVMLTISCASSSGSGQVYNNYVGGILKEGRLKSASLTLEGCSVVGQPKCFVNGAASGAGKITTNPLGARLGYEPGTLNLEALVTPENAESLFTTIKITECASEGNYRIKGNLVAGVEPAATFVVVAKAILTTTSGAQQKTSIEFPDATVVLTGQELKFGTKGVGVEGTLGLELFGGEKIGYF